MSKEIMGFRQKKQEDKEWAEWQRRHADLIETAGLPALVVSDEDRWHEFIEHGQLLHCGEEVALFNVDWLTLRQKAATLRLIRTRPHLHAYGIEMSLTEEMIRAVERLAPE